MTEASTNTNAAAEERARCAELRGYGVLDTANEPAFDDLVRQAAAACGTPIALISLIDENRQWFKARVGLAAPETPLQDDVAGGVDAVHLEDMLGQIEADSRKLRRGWLP